jgi:hypothetical protein
MGGSTEGSNQEDRPLHVALAAGRCSAKSKQNRDDSFSFIRLVSTLASQVIFAVRALAVPSLVCGCFLSVLVAQQR